MIINKLDNVEVCEDGHKYALRDMNEKFLDEKGAIRAGPVMPDALHPIAGGYEIWLSEMCPVVDRLLSE